jgi:hypothetical protein
MSLTALDSFVCLVIPVTSLVVFGYYLFQQFTIQLIAAVAVYAVNKLYN